MRRSNLPTKLLQAGETQDHGPVPTASPLVHQKSAAHRTHTLQRFAMRRVLSRAQTFALTLLAERAALDVRPPQ
ncbi:hypothetical protein CSA80_05010 [Candidatus Saccharibacteria bacterium]|nr:MAG: hypothetical protein CSA80_05010 [Candidatus Saccharibacteria bacterium]